jgi:uncharacterized protein YkwD
MFFLNILFVLAGFFNSNDPGPKAVSSVNKTVLLQLVNKVRQTGCQCGDTYYNSAPALAWNEKLEEAALKHSTDMFTRKYFSHVSPDGVNPGTRITDAGYRWRAFGENIAMGYPTENQVIEGWIKSPVHCRNIMNKDFKEMGVARSGSYWTQEFASR